MSHSNRSPPEGRTCDISHSRRFLIVDDDRLYADVVRDLFVAEGHVVEVAGDLASAKKLISELQPDLVLLDQSLPDGEGWTICEEILEANARAKIIFNTAFPSFDSAVQAVRGGAFDYLSKPVELGHLQLSVRRALEQLGLEHIASAKRRRDKLEARSSELIGDSAAMQEVRHLVRVAAEVDAPLLLTGETGTGKTIVARAVHEASARRRGEFVSVNASSFPATLIEAELFGHERGAFSGADEAREGLFEFAHGGTLFLDEIGEMPLALQSRLLTVLEDRAVRRLGGRAQREVDFRFIAATNRDLMVARDEGTFRADLYYRLDVLRIHLPPLRDRADDIPLLAKHFLARLVPEREVQLAPDELERLKRYEWPGNLRELANILERAVLIQRGRPLQPSLLLPRTSGTPPCDAGPDPWEGLTLEAIERRVAERVLQRTGGNLADAARILGVSVSTLRRRFPPAERSKTIPARQSERSS